MTEHSFIICTFDFKPVEDVFFLREANNFGSFELTTRISRAKKFFDIDAAKLVRERMLNQDPYENVEIKEVKTEIVA